MNYKIKEILNSISIYGFSIIFSRIIPFITIPIIVNNLTINEYGELGQIQSLIALLISVSTLNVASSNYRFQRHTSNRYSNSYNALLYRSSNLITIISIFCFSFLCFFIFDEQHYFISILFLFSQSVYNYLLSLLRAKNKSLVYTSIELFKNINYILALKYLSKFHILNINNILNFQSYISIFCIAFLTIYLWRFNLIGLKFSKVFTKEILRYSLPTLGAYFIQTFLQQSQLILLDFSDEFLGYINFANKFSLIIFGIQSIIFLAWPYFAFKYQDSKIHQTIFKLLSIILIVFIWTVYFLYDDIVEIIANSNYLKAKLFTIGFLIVYSISILGSFMDNSPSVDNKTYLITIIYCLGGVAALIFYNIIPDRILVTLPYLPLLVSYTLMLILRIYMYKKWTNFISWNNSYILFSIINFSIIILISYL